jgi:hypothetical protein
MRDDIARLKGAVPISGTAGFVQYSLSGDVKTAFAATFRESGTTITEWFYDSGRFKHIGIRIRDVPTNVHDSESGIVNGPGRSGA